ncbi:hypothetical protein [Arthrobacter russicus]|uniref:Uncharacterized protein n=1 Tax=Arthrobacter russicus TaxID=172040 RepID=A0ABU1J9L0_9MICC|nr:hypothetical protein [Arthrobacter russicus]MDN5668941.1 hypothetical protein [Renibacterium salmoninarum]MDR6268844.1 hypothetical protein [Arthrobacter russicus]
MILSIVIVLVAPQNDAVMRDYPKTKWFEYATRPIIEYAADAFNYIIR